MGRTELARLFVAIGGLIVLALTAALVGPYFIDWSSYRAQFEREAGRILGREVTVNGTARARLLPFPSVTFTDVSVAGEQPGGEPAMTVDEFSMYAELAPFLRGEVLIFDMRLVRPTVSVEVDEDGGIDWAVRPSSPFDPRQVTLEKVSVSDGTIIVHHAESGRVHRVTGIDAKLSARTLAGPWRLDGSAKIDGERTAISISTGALNSDGRLRVRVEAQPERYAVKLEADGDARFEGGKAVYSGTFRLEERVAHAEVAAEPDSSAFPPATQTGRENVETPPGNRLYGTFSLDSERLSVDQFRFETGPEDDPYVAEGKAYVTLGAQPRFSIAADGAQVHFDRSAAGVGGPIAGMSPEERLSALSKMIAELPRPGIPGTVKVNLPAIVTGDTTIRDVELSAEPAETGWKIASMAATLPGRTRFEGDGLLSTVGELSFSGRVLLAVRQPSGFAAWLARDVDDAIRRLPAAGFSAEVSLTRRHQIFDNLELVLGDARFHGRIERREPENAAPSLEVSLDGGRLNVEGLTAFASIFVSDEGVNRLAGHDVDLHIKAGPVEAAGLTAATLDTALRLRQGNLEIDKLALTGLAGASVSATGTLGDFSGEPTGKIDATVVSVDLAPLVSTLAERFPDNRLIGILNRHANNYPGLLEDAEINIVASAADNGDRTAGMAISAQGVAGGTSFSFAVSGRDLLRHPQTAPFTVNFSGRNDEAAALYALYGIPGIPIGLAGAARTELSAKGSLARGLDTTFRFAGDGLEANFHGTFRLKDGNPALEGEGRLSSTDIEPWLAAAAITVPGFGYGLPVELRGDLKYSGGLLAVSDLTGDVGGSALAGDLKAELVGGVPHISGALDVEYLNARPGLAMVLGERALEVPANGLWPRKPFAQKASPPFTADMRLGARKLALGSSDAVSSARMRLELDESGLELSDLSAELFGGRLKGLLTLRNNGGTGLLSAQFSLRDANLAKILPRSGLTGRTDLAASVTATGKSVEGMMAALAGSGSISARDLVIAGINPHAFRPILERADAIGRDINADDTAAFAPAIVQAGALDAGSAELAFTITDGVARTPLLRLERSGLVLTAESRVDFRAMTAHVDGSVLYDAGKEALAGSEPAVRFAVDGPVGALKTSLGTQPLAQYLTQRALEKEQARVEHMQAVLLEKQRLRREARYYAALEEKRRRAEEERRRFELETERARARAEAEAQEAQRRRKQAEEAAERARRGRRTEEVTTGEDNRVQEDRATPSRMPGGAVESEGENTAIERKPLPPPGRPSDDGNAAHDDAVSRFFEPENLTVEGLLELIRPENR